MPLEINRRIKTAWIDSFIKNNKEEPLLCYSDKRESVILAIRPYRRSQISEVNYPVWEGSRDRSQLPTRRETELFPLDTKEGLLSQSPGRWLVFKDGLGSTINTVNCVVITLKRKEKGEKGLKRCQEATPGRKDRRACCRSAIPDFNAGQHRSCKLYSGTKTRFLCPLLPFHAQTKSPGAFST